MESTKKIKNLTILLPSKNHEAHIVKNLEKLTSFVRKILRIMKFWLYPMEVDWK